MNESLTRVFQLASMLNGMFNLFHKFGIPALRIRHSGVRHSGPHSAYRPVPVQTRDVKIVFQLNLY